MKTTKSIFFLSVFLLLLLFCASVFESCRKNTNLGISNTDKVSDPIELLKNGKVFGDVFIQDKMTFDTSQLPLSAVVESHRMKKRSIEKATSRTVISKDLANQYKLVSDGKYQFMTVKIVLYDNGVVRSMSMYESNLDKAIYNWNSLLPKSGVFFQKVSADTIADIELVVHNFGETDWGGLAFLPMGGNPGKYIYLNDYWLKGTSWNTQYSLASLITHELGHTLGFLHSDQDLSGIEVHGSDLSNIPSHPYYSFSKEFYFHSTYDEDPHSIMKSGMGTGPWTQDYYGTQSIYNNKWNIYATVPIGYTYDGANNVSYSTNACGFTMRDIDEFSSIYPITPGSYPNNVGQVLPIIFSTSPHDFSDATYQLVKKHPYASFVEWKILKIVDYGEQIESEYTPNDVEYQYLPHIWSVSNDPNNNTVTLKFNSNNPYVTTVRLRAIVSKGTWLVKLPNSYSSYYYDIDIPYISF